MIAEVLNRLGLKRALVVASHDGLDEISISAPTQVSELRNGEVHTYDIDPRDMGLSLHPLDAVLGDAAQNAEIIHRIFQGERSAYRDVVLLNAGACIYLSGLADSIANGVKIAAEAVDSGKAANKRTVNSYNGGVQSCILIELLQQNIKKCRLLPRPSTWMKRYRKLNSYLLHEDSNRLCRADAIASSD